MNRTMKRRNKLNWHQNHGVVRTVGGAQREPVGWLSGVRRRGGTNLRQAQLRNRRDSYMMQREKAQAVKVRLKVPKHVAESDCVIVVRRPLKRGRAKGAACQVKVVLTTRKGRIRATETKSVPITKQMVWAAFKKVKANRGAGGVDGVSLKKYEEKVGDNLYVLWNRMSSGSYFPPPVKEVEIPKGNGKMRSLGIPTVADRIAQMVVKDHLEPKLEPIFNANSFGYRPGKSAHEALEQAKQNCWKYAWVIDMDIQSFFDEIDHELMMKALKVHTEEKWVLMYAERWLKAPMSKADGRMAEREKGTPQGGVISPLLANLFLHYAFDNWMEIHCSGQPFERYADDIIVHCQTEAEARETLERIRQRLSECKLRLHPEKTRIVYCKNNNRKEPYQEVSFDFLGYTFKPRKSKRKDGSIFLNYSLAVSTKSKKKMNQKIREMKIQRQTGNTLLGIAKELNPTVRGWMNYFIKFNRGELWEIFKRLNERLAKWARRKYKRFKGSVYRATEWLKDQARKTPTLFAHWKEGYRPLGMGLTRRAV